MEPLPLGKLVDFFLSAWNLFEVIESNFDPADYDQLDEIHCFFEASSEFYPEFDRAVRRRVDYWLDEFRSQ